MNLKQAYLATTYQAQVTPTKTLHIRAEKRNPELDEYLQEHETWAYITAWNPDSQELSPSENEQRHQQLETVLQEKGYSCFQGAGVPDDTKWTPETSFWILGISKQDAKALGQQFVQRAIVWGKRGEVSELINCLRDGFGA